MRLISVVVPLKDEKENVRPLFERVRDALRQRFVGTRARGRRQHRRHVRRTRSGRGRGSAREGRAPAPQLRPERRDAGRARCRDRRRDRHDGRRPPERPGRHPAAARETRRGLRRGPRPAPEAAGQAAAPQGAEPGGELADPQGARRAVQGLRLHAAGDAPRGDARPGALRRDAPLHHGARHPARCARSRRCRCGITRGRPGSRSTTSRARSACCST